MLQYCLDSHPFVSYAILALFLAILISLNLVPRETKSDQFQNDPEELNSYSIASLYREFLLFFRSAHFRKLAEPTEYPSLYIPKPKQSEPYLSGVYWSTQNFCRPSLDKVSRVDPDENIAENFAGQQADSGIFLDTSFDLDPDSKSEPSGTKTSDPPKIFNDESLFFDDNIFDSLADHVFHFLTRQPKMRSRIMKQADGPTAPTPALEEIVANTQTSNCNDDCSLFFDKNVFDSPFAGYIIWQSARKCLDPQQIHSTKFEICLREIIATHRPLPDYKSERSLHQTVHIFRFGPVLESIRAISTGRIPRRHFRQRYDQDCLIQGENLFVSLPETFRYYFLGKAICVPPADLDFRYHKVKMAPTMQTILDYSTKDDQILPTKLKGYLNFLLISASSPPIQSITKDNVLDQLPLPVYIPLKLAEVVFDKSTSMVASSISRILKPFR